MSYLLDTNVISEVVRSNPNKNVIEWFKSVPDEALFISVLTIGEIRKGTETVKDHKRREKLRLWLEIELPRWFADRILDIDLHIADRWGRLQSEIKKPIPAIDSLLAATALHHDLRLVTRNTKDFKYPLLQVICPWNNE